MNFYVHHGKDVGWGRVHDTPWGRVRAGLAAVGLRVPGAVCRGCRLDLARPRNPSGNPIYQQFRTVTTQTSDNEYYVNFGRFTNNYAMLACFAGSCVGSGVEGGVRVDEERHI